ncbi:MAG TPA: hypothetical protein VFJ04_01710, partial [Rhodanobacteraceae bacterium]|nr:hypothetical protein [Rhodanobacteraceae bacterium]
MTYALLALAFLGAIIIGISIARSRFLGKLSRASLDDGLRRPRLFALLALAVCVYATFCMVVSHTYVVPDSPMYFWIGPLVVCWTAVLFCLWILA